MPDVNVPKCISDKKISENFSTVRNVDGISGGILITISVVTSGQALIDSRVARWFVCKPEIQI
jgi:hypothetical protein